MFFDDIDLNHLYSQVSIGCCSSMDFIEEQEKKMKDFNTVLVAVDGSAMAMEALKRAISIAKKKDAQLIVVHVIEPPFVESPLLQPVDKEVIKKEIAEKIEKLDAEADLTYVLFVESGLAVNNIITKIEKTKADLLVIGSHGKDDVSSTYFGSTALKLVHNTHIPVLIVKNEANDNYQKILAPTNLSDYSKESILFANTLFNDASIKYLYAHESVDEVQALRYHISLEELHKFKSELFSDAKTALEKFVKEVAEGEMELINFHSSINEDILSYLTADKADLLVLGSKGVNNLNSFLFGSTASYLIQRSPSDVLAYVPAKKQD